MEALFPLQIVFGFVTAWGFSLAAIPLVIRWATNRGVFDFPDSSQADRGGRRVHCTPIPRLGGVAIVISFFATNLIWATSKSANAIFAASFALFLMGLIDDLRSIRARYKLFIQIIAAFGVIQSCGLVLTQVAVTPDYAFTIPVWLGYALSLFILVGAVNAVNMIDGLDGLAGGVSIISIALLSLVYFVQTQDLSVIAFLSIPIFGSVLGFLRYNTHPASIFMGDSGSNWLGFMAGIMLLLVLGNFDVQAVFGIGDSNQSQLSHFFPFASGVLCLAIPVFDTASVIVARLRHGISPTSADNRHFHHSLLRLGLTHSQSVTAIYFLSLVVGVFGLLPVLFPRYNFWWTPYVGIAVLIIVISRHLQIISILFRPLMSSLWKDKSRERSYDNINTIVYRWERFNRCCIYGIFLVSPMFAGSIRSELGYVALAGLALVALTQFLTKVKNDFTFSLVMSIGTTILLTANNQNQMMISILGEVYSFQIIYNTVFVLLFLSTVGQVLFTLKRKFFIFTPSDFLLTCFPLLLTLMPDSIRTEYRLDIIALRSFVVFMAIRVMIKKHRTTSRKLSVVNAVALGYVAAAGLLQLRFIY